VAATKNIVTQNLSYMQIQHLSLVSILATLFLTTSLQAQADDNYRMAPNKDDIQIDLLGNYYNQDGSFGAPQGGIGTEQLDNVAGLFIVKVPIDSNSSLQVQAGADYYSSASTDRIDYQASSESSSDLRAYGSVTWSERDLRGGRTYSVTLGGSNEYDYTSINGTLGFSQEWDRGASELSVGARAFFDNWDYILPLEFRRPGQETQNTNRRSFGLSAVYSRIINRRLQIAITTELNYMEGLLSTPFHRIYYSGAPENAYERFFPADAVERLPSTRLKVPVSARLNWMISDELSLRTFARYYSDNWGVSGFTGDIELGWDVSAAFTVMPGFRYYNQQGSTYYAPFATALPTQEFITSDIDLSTLTMTKLGLGVRFAPVVGLARGRLGKVGLDWRQVTLRGALYDRNPGLTAYSFTLSTGIILRKLK